MEFFIDRLNEFENLEHHRSSRYMSLLNEVYLIINTTEPQNINQFTKTLIKRTAEAVVHNSEQFETRLRQRTYNNGVYAFLNPNNSLHLFYFRMKKCYSSLLTLLNDNKDQLMALLTSKHNLFDALDKLKEKIKTEDGIINSKNNMSNKTETQSCTSHNLNDSFKVVANISINSNYILSLNCYTENMAEVKTLLKLQTEIKAKQALEKLIPVEDKIKNKEIGDERDLKNTVNSENLFSIDTEHDSMKNKKIKQDKTVFLFKNKEIDVGECKGKIKILDLKKKIGVKIGLKFNKIKLEINSKIMKDIEVVDLNDKLEIIVKQKVRGGKHN